MGLLKKPADESAYNQKWEIPIMTAPCENPSIFCYALCCSCILIKDQRFALIGGPVNYVCCNSAFGCCSTCWNPCTEQCPTFCAVCEGLCCPYIGTLINRDLIRSKHHMEFTECEECILTTVCVCQWVCCIFSILNNGRNPGEDLVDCMMWCLIGCFGAQQEVEMMKRGDYGQPQVMQ